MDKLEEIGDLYEVNFCDLFVREHNMGANLFYEKLNYVKYRIIKEYYGG